MDVDNSPLEIEILAAILGKLSKIKMSDWYRYAFSKDPLNGRLTDRQRKMWMEQAMECGMRYSRMVCKEYGIRDPLLLAEKMGIHVTYEIEDVSDQMIFAQYIEPDQIRLNQNLIRRAEAYMKVPEVSAVLPDGFKIQKVLLAHELFHHVEELYQNEIFTRTEKLRLWSLGPFHNDSRILALSEIAAMSFACEMTDTRYSPYLLDVLLIYGHSAADAVELFREMSAYTDRKKAPDQRKER